MTDYAHKRMMRRRRLEKWLAKHLRMNRGTAMRLSRWLP